MSAFDRIIGYDTIKKELVQLCDMFHNYDLYKKLGAKLPSGVLLYGDPGLGKSLMAKCFIEESGVKAFTVRRNKNEDFVDEITSSFEEARKAAPSIVFLDDMDKFANVDDEHPDAPEYVAVQAGIDSVKGEGVFVFATVNEVHKLPDSLRRSGRFDRKMEVQIPTEKDAENMIQYYLTDKPVADDVNMRDLANMISYCTCAELETILNEAAITAAYERHEKIEMQDMLHAVLRMEYNSPDIDYKTNAEDLKRVAMHEAGHLVVSEALCPGSVGLASIRATGRESENGFIHRCKEIRNREQHIMISLAGKVAAEMYHPQTRAQGCYSDLKRAFNAIRDDISESAACGIGMIDVADYRFPETSESLNARNEAVVHAEMERYAYEVRNILIRNRDFLEKAAEALLEKETLLSSDIEELRSRITESRKSA